ncbi:hypothetical protein ACFC1B_07045 [Streptomyces xiamenensis]|uniref:hypothetical protein n=1 Tax=Streptomyces xiamenensis TaxID=408015 RepID=UPI0035D73EE6
MSEWENLVTGLRIPTASRAVVQCARCPDAPVLASPDPLINTDKCVRCQHRRLPEPHPEEHLCAVCRRECPRCGGPTAAGGPCRSCKSQCRTCGRPISQGPAPEVRREFADPEPEQPTPARPLITPGQADPTPADDAEYPQVVRDHLKALQVISPDAAERARAAAKSMYGPNAAQRRDEVMAASAAWIAATAAHNDAVTAYLAANPPPEAPAVPRRTPPPTRGKRPIHRERVYAPRSTRQGQCDACLSATDKAADPLRVVLAALPARVVRACTDGRIPQQVVATIRDELLHHTALQLTERAQGRWDRRLSHTRVQRKENDSGTPAEQILAALVTPGPCAARCNDGWEWDGNMRCVHCPPPAVPAPEPEPDEDSETPDRTPSGPAERTPAQAVTWRPAHNECDGRDGSCGVVVAPPYTRCPSCSRWPTCRCGTRYDPHRGCRTCGPAS